MALTAEVTKESVTNTMSKAWKISLLVTLKEDAVEVRSETVSVDFKTGDSIAAKGAVLLEAAQAVVDKYKSEDNIFDNASLDTVVTGVQAGLVV